MERIKLNEYLEKEKNLHSGMTVSCSIISSLEVYGFLNCKGRADILSGYAHAHDLNSYGDVEMKFDSAKCKVYSFYMKQNTKVTPIYPTAAVCQKDVAIDVKELYIPGFLGTRTTRQSIEDDALYKNIKRRFGTGYEVSEDEWRKAGWPSRYSLENGSVMSHIHEGEIVLKDKDGCIRSVGDSIVVLCRYVQEEIGEVRFFFSRLEHLYCQLKDSK